MIVIKTALGVFIGVLGALLTHDAIREYRQLGPHRLAVDVRPGPDPEPQIYRNGEPVRELKTLPPSIYRGSIEWTDKPDTKRLVP